MSESERDSSEVTPGTCERCRKPVGQTYGGLCIDCDASEDESANEATPVDAAKRVRAAIADPSGHGLRDALLGLADSLEADARAKNAQTIERLDLRGEAKAWLDANGYAESDFSDGYEADVASLTALLAKVREQRVDKATAEPPINVRRALSRLKAWAESATAPNELGWQGIERDVETVTRAVLPCQAHHDRIRHLERELDTAGASTAELSWIKSYLGHYDQDCNHAWMARRIDAVLAGKDPSTVQGWTEHDGVREPRTDYPTATLLDEEDRHG